MLAPEAPPQIVEVQIPSTTVTGGELVSGDVIASSNVASVVVAVAGQMRPMQKIAPGHFRLAVTAPRLPFFLRNRTYSLEIIARNSNGVSVTQWLPIRIR